jgi:hypothetical protein
LITPLLIIDYAIITPPLLAPCHYAFAIIYLALLIIDDWYLLRHYAITPLRRLLLALRHIMPRHLLLLLPLIAIIEILRHWYCHYYHYFHY